MKMYGIHESVHNLFEKGAKSEPKVSQREPERIELKRSQKGANGSQKGATWRPKGGKSEPRGDQNAQKNRVAEKVAKGKKDANHTVPSVH